VRRGLAALLSVGLTVAVAASLYDLPAERPVELSPGPGVALVSAHCSACHSLDYLTTQPPAMGTAFWADNVAKMVDVHGAEIPEGDRAVIIAYLGRVFGGADAAPPTEGSQG